MADRTILIFDKTDVVLRSASGDVLKGDVLGKALNGNAFSWAGPGDLSLTFPKEAVKLTFADEDGLLSDDPYKGDRVLDQRLLEPVKIAGQQFEPSAGEIRWGKEAPVTVEDEYEVTLFDSSGAAYRMVGVSITKGYATQVVGVTFDGPAPPPGTVLHYHQGKSDYSGEGSMKLQEDIPCFLAGTRIATPRGPRPVEALRVGDRVVTLDHGPQPLRWIGRGRVRGRGVLAPLRIEAPGGRGLNVSPNHRLLLRAPRADLYFGSAEVLVAARHLLEGRTARRMPCRVADYLHLAFDRHEIVLSEGLASESLYLGPVAAAALDAAARAELRAVLPWVGRRPQRLGRRALTAGEARLLLAAPGWTLVPQA